MTSMLSCWGVCAALLFAVAGPRRIAALRRPPRAPLPEPPWLALVALTVPPAGALATELAPQLGRATRWSAARR
jgi:hypothetical protein